MPGELGLGRGPALSCDCGEGVVERVHGTRRDVCFLSFVTPPVDVPLSPFPPRPSLPP